MTQMIGAVGIAAQIAIPQLKASLSSAAQATLEGGKAAGKNFAEGFAPEIAGFSMFKQLGEMMATQVPGMMLNAGQIAAESFMSGLKAFKSGDAEAVFSSVIDSMGKTVEFATEVGQSFAALAGRWAPMLEGAIGAIGGALGTFVQQGGEYLSFLTEIGDKYSTLTRTLSESTIDLAAIEPLGNMVRDIMGGASVDKFEDVATTIGRFSRTMNLAGPELQQFTQNYAAMAEMIGSQNPVDIAGIMKAYEVDLGDAANEMTKLGNITRGTGGDAGRLIDALVRSGPAMRNLGYGASDTALLFGGMIQEGLRGTKLVYGMNQIVDKVGAAASEGVFGTYAADLADTDEKMGHLAGQTLTTADAFMVLVENVKKLMAGGQRDAAYKLLSQYTTPANATLMAEMIAKGAIASPEALKAATEGYTQDLGSMATATADLADTFENSSQTFQAALAPIGLAFAKGIMGPMSDFTTWMSENQEVVSAWALKISDIVITGFGAIGDFAGKILEGIGGFIDPLTYAISTVMEPILYMFQSLFDILEHLPDWAGGGMFDGFKDAFDGVDKLNEKMRDTSFSEVFERAGQGLQDLSSKAPGAIKGLHDVHDAFARSQKIERAFELPDVDKYGNEITRFGYTGMTHTEGANPLSNPQVFLNPGDIDKIKGQLAALGIDVVVDMSTGLIQRVETHTQEAATMWDEWWTGQSRKKRQPIDVPLQMTDPFGNPGDYVEELLKSSGVPIDVKANITGTDGGSPSVAAAPAVPSFVNPYDVPLGSPGQYGGGGTGSGAGRYSPSANLPGMPLPAGVPTTGAPLNVTGAATAVKATAGRDAGIRDSGGTIQPLTAMAERAVMEAFKNTAAWIGNNYRHSDGPDEHSSGEATDIMVSQLGTKSAASLQLGDDINQWMLDHAEQLGLKYTIWKETLWFPGGDTQPAPAGGATTAGHYDHVHGRFNPGVPGAAQLASGTTPAAAPAAPAPAPSPVLSGAPTGGAGTTGVMMDGQEKKYWTVEANGAVVWRGQSGNPTKPPAGQPGAAATTPPPSTWPPTSSSSSAAASPFTTVKTSGDLAALKASGEWASLSAEQQKQLTAKVTANAGADGPAFRAVKTYAELMAFKQTDQYAKLAANQQKALSDQVFENLAKVAELSLEAAKTQKDAADQNAATEAARQEAQAQAQAQAELIAGRPYGPGLNESYKRESDAASGYMQQAKDTYGGSGGIPGYLDANGKPIGKPAQVFGKDWWDSRPKNPDVGANGYKPGYQAGMDGVPMKSRDMVQDVKDVASGAWGAVENAWKWAQKGIVGGPLNADNSMEKGEWNPKKWLWGKMGFASGGQVFGAGTATSDSIPAWLSNGEFVHNADAVAHYGTSFMSALNQKRLPKFAPGGQVGSDMVTTPNGIDVRLWDLRVPGMPGTGRGGLGTGGANDPWMNPVGTPEDVEKAIFAFVDWQKQQYVREQSYNDQLKAREALAATITELRGEQATAQAALDLLLKRKADFEATGASTAIDVELLEAIDKNQSAVNTIAGKIATDQENLAASDTALRANRYDREKADIEGPPDLKTDKKEGKSDKDAETLGRGLVTGIFEGLGFPDVFGKAFTDWGLWKMATGVAGFGLELAQGHNLLPGPGQSGAGLGPGVGAGAAFGGLQQLLPGAAERLPPVAGAPGLAASVTPAMSQSQAPANGGLFDVNRPTGPLPGPVFNQTINAATPAAMHGAAQSGTRAMASVAPSNPSVNPAATPR